MFRGEINTGTSADTLQENNYGGKVFFKSISLALNKHQLNDPNQ